MATADGAATADGRAPPAKPAVATAGFSDGAVLATPPPPDADREQSGATLCSARSPPPSSRRPSKPAAAKPAGNPWPTPARPHVRLWTGAWRRDGAAPALRSATMPPAAPPAGGRAAARASAAGGGARTAAAAGTGAAAAAAAALHRRPPPPATRCRAAARQPRRAASATAAARRSKSSSTAPPPPAAIAGPPRAGSPPATDVMSQIMAEVGRRRSSVRGPLLRTRMSGPRTDRTYTVLNLPASLARLAVVISHDLTPLTSIESADFIFGATFRASARLATRTATPHRGSERQATLPTAEYRLRRSARPAPSAERSPHGRLVASVPAAAAVSRRARPRSRAPVETRSDPRRPRAARLRARRAPRRHRGRSRRERRRRRRRARLRLGRHLSSTASHAARRSARAGAQTRGAESRQCARRLKRRLDRHRPRAAARVEERRRLIPAAPPHHRRRHRLSQSHLRRLRPPAASVQLVARRVDADGEDIVDRAHDDAQRVVAGRPARHPALQPLLDCLRVVERRRVRAHVEPQRLVADVRAPVEALNFGLEARKGVGLEREGATRMRVAPAAARSPRTARGCSAWRWRHLAVRTAV